MKDRPLCDRESDTHFFLATSLGITLMAAAAGALAEGPNPLDADAPVTSTTYKSPLADFRAFDPDESMQSWVDANRRVDEIGGWRTYLRQANPPKKPISKAPAQAKPASTKPVEPKMDAPKKQDTIAPASASGIPALAEGGTDQQDEIELSPPDLPERFSRGECPRVLTGLRLPVSPRVVELSKNTERLLARVTKCFKTRSYVVSVARRRCAQLLNCQGR